MNKFAVIFQLFHMSFRNTCFKQQLSVAAIVGRENALAMTIRIGMCVFLCSNKSKISFFPSNGPVTHSIIKFTTIIQTS